MEDDEPEKRFILDKSKIKQTFIHMRLENTLVSANLFPHRMRTANRILTEL